ncbi:MAG: CYTH domain-containing protein [Candidatus Andersenbacteria bacterium]
MIEVERTFLLTNEVERRLLDGATARGTVTMTDSYYDKPTYEVSLRDEWLRNRNGHWELKVPRRTEAAQRGVDLYDELDDEAAIREHLGLPKGAALRDALTAAGYVPFATVVTTRRKFEKGGFHIDLDDVDFGYRVGEVELMANDDTGAAAASKRVDDFCDLHGIPRGYVRGKVVEFMRRSRPELYQRLAAVGIISSQEAMQA